MKKVIIIGCGNFGVTTDARRLLEKETSFKIAGKIHVYNGINHEDNKVKTLSFKECKNFLREEKSQNRRERRKLNRRK